MYENEKKNDQIASSTGQSSVSDSQRLSAGILTPILTQALHATSIVRHSGIAAISKNRLSRHHTNAQGLLRSAQGPWTQEDTALFHSMLCRTKAAKKRAFEKLTQEDTALFHSMLCRAKAAKKRAFEKLLASIFKCAEAIAMLDEPPEAAIDSTGLETRHVSRHFVRCTKRPSYFRRTWPKVTIVCDTHTHLIAGCIVTRGPSYDFPLFEKAILGASKQLRFARILADGGYDSEANHRFGREVLGIHTIIALNARGFTKTPTTPYRAEMKHQFDKETFNHRWQVESVFSRDKRLLGSALHNRTEVSRQRECLLRVLTHNLMIIRRAA